MEILYNHENGIGFRRVSDTDLTDLISLKNESWFGTHTITMATPQSQTKWLESVNAESHCPKNLILIASTLPDTIYVNRGIFKIANIDWISRRAEVGWDVYKEHRKQGYGAKIVKAGVDFCFKVLNLRRLDAQILTTNTASLKCAVEAGFVTEGRQPNAIFKNGVYIDNILLGATNG